MTSRETILKAFEGGKPDRVPVTLFGGGMWSIKEFGSTFKDLSLDAQKMSDMLVSMSEKLLCDIVYAGSGYNNFHASAFGGGIKFREMGAPDLICCDNDGMGSLHPWRKNGRRRSNDEGDLQKARLCS
jgi:uroporphyrinogen-III decarboxylase